MLVLGFAHPVGALLSSPVGPSAAADSLPLLPTPRVIAIRGKPRAFQLLDYEVSILPGVDGLHARKLATLCGYNGRSPLCERPLRALPARAPSWTDEAVSRGLESWGLNLGRGGSGLLPALARVCAARGSKLTFHTLPLPDWLRDEQYSYLARAEATGAVEIVEHKETADFNAYRSEAAGPHVVPQGGQWADAEPGIVALADAIGAWWKTRPGGGLDVPRASREASRGLDVVLPAGTGTTALFLARHAPPGVRIYAVPCNGNAQQLRSRMEYLDARSGGLQVYPRVLSPPQSHTVPLGKVSAAMLAAWRDAIYHGCLLDLVYGPVAWSALEACEWSLGDAAKPPTGASGSSRDDDDEQGTSDGGGSAALRDVLYVNTGGHECLEFQLRRYLRAGFLNKYEFSNPNNADPGLSYRAKADKWYAGQWGIEQVLDDARRVAAQKSGLLHTRDAGL